MLALVTEDFTIALILLMLGDNILWEYEQDSHFSHPFTGELC